VSQNNTGIEGNHMTPPELLKLLRLLSALESWAFSTKTALPDYLHDDLGAMITRLEEEILKGQQ
jgi:hypothetical protein